MPVFSRVRDGVLVLTVDGDYTANELRRVGFSAFEAEETPHEVPVVLDLSGTVVSPRHPTGVDTSIYAVVNDDGQIFEAEIIHGDDVETITP